jgi:hypothetical protein
MKKCTLCKSLVEKKSMPVIKTEDFKTEQAEVYMCTNKKCGEKFVEAEVKTIKIDFKLL